ncbi:MAG: ClpXP protease specificity-enhancing factor [Gammaproteobacteria bacterium]|nr:ClpXP protease specificity-enhancing factor [Gammaproteobacteria bacterium]
MSQFTSNKPYLFRAIYEWLIDNDAIPYILVDALIENTQVPEAFIKDDQIVLNISPEAVFNWHCDNHAISFNARFSGVSHQLFVPMDALMAVYDKTTGMGMAFPESYDQSSDEDDELDISIDDLESEASVSNEKVSKNKGSHLKVIK